LHRCYSKPPSAVLMWKDHPGWEAYPNENLQGETWLAVIPSTICIKYLPLISLMSSSVLRVVLRDLYRLTAFISRNQGKHTY
jgi:hypothetical protein